MLLCEAGATAAVDVRGAAPATRETDLLRPENTVQQVNAVLLTGGSAFGLAAADGCVQYLEERGMGFATGAGPVPIVPAAALFDLGMGDSTARPAAAAGYSACRAASSLAVAEGSVGAGTGATVGHLRGIRSEALHARPRQVQLHEAVGEHPIGAGHALGPGLGVRVVQP